MSDIAGEPPKDINTNTGTRFNHPPATLWMLDQQGVIIQSEGVGLQALGRSPEDWLGQSAYNLFQADEASLVAIRRALQGMAGSYTIQLNGRWLQVHSAPVFSEHHAVIGASVVSIDVTENRPEKGASAAVLGTEATQTSASFLNAATFPSDQGSIRNTTEVERQASACQLKVLSQAIEQGPVSVMITDADGCINYVNSAFSTRMGYCLDEIKGLTPRVIKGGDTRPEVYENLWRTIRSGAVWHGELLNRTKDGKAVYERQTITPIRNSEGNIVHYVAIEEDISRLKTSERALRKSNRMLRMLSECNQALVRSSTEQELLDGICRILVDHGGYPCAWIGAANSSSADSIRAVSSVGGMGACLDTFSAEQWGQDVPGRCIRDNEVIVCRDIGADLSLAWSEQAAKCDIRSAIALPVLHPDHQVFSLIWVFSDQPDAFDAQECQLLTALADDLRFGLATHQTRRALCESEAQFRSLAEDSMAGIYMIQDGRFVYANPQMEEIFGYSMEQIVGGMNVADLVADDSKAVVAENLKKRLTGDTHSIHYDFTGLRSDGELIRVEVFGARTQFNGKDSVVGTLIDITERRALEKQLLLMQRAIESVNSGIAIADVNLPDNPFVYVNPAFEAITGYAQEEVLGRNGRFLLGADIDQPELEKLRLALSNRIGIQLVVRNYHRNGSLFWNDLSVAPVQDEQGNTTHFVSILNDISERKHQEHQLEKLTNYDSLTGLGNKNLLRDRLEQSVIHSGRNRRYTALVLIDLDRFKMLNQSLGATVSDAVLKQIGGRVSGWIRDGDTVARLGADDYGVVLHDVKDVSDIAPLAQQFMDAISKPLDVGPVGMALTSSIGISVYPQDGVDADALIRNAEAALFKAMEQQNCFCFYTPELNAKAHDRLTLEVDLRRACQHNEFILHFQPKVDLQTGAVTGAEALIRWMHPERGLVPPNDFIPAAEDTGLIKAMGEWALTEACRAIVRINAACGTPLSIAVNLSAKQFIDESLASSIQNILKITGLPSHLLECELTESMLMDDPSTSLVTLNDLKALGVRIALDDFGTGYSSLAYLKRFPIDTLKIDSSFVSDIPDDEHDKAIAKAVIALADSLGLYVVAEGVETEEQRSFLKQERCDSMQGFLFSRPLPEVDFMALLNETKLVEPEGYQQDYVVDQHVRLTNISV